MREQLAIEDHGAIGDMHTLALVGKNGCIDWLCFPHFSSPSVFAALLDSDRGGFFSICPRAEKVTSKQSYWPDTNVMTTRFFTEAGAAELIDFMPLCAKKSIDHQSEIIRQVTVIRGEMPLRLECRPAFDYARAPHEVSVEGKLATFRSEALWLQLSSEVPLSLEEGGVTADFTLKQGQSIAFRLTGAPPEKLQERRGRSPGSQSGSRSDDIEELFQATVEYWHRWLSRCNYEGRWREQVRRSALALKLLTFAPTGAILAAPTTSLPESLGGERNWDYRFTWIRDSAFTIFALLRLGFTEEATAFIEFLQSVCTASGDHGPLQLMYGIFGGRDLSESTLDHLRGYRGSKPVRVGNGAYDQLQLDIYGELIDCIYLYDKHAEPIAFETWKTVRRFADWVMENWQREDEGIWEVRSGRRHFVYSKLMCWVALDRACRLARRRSLPSNITSWERARDQIYMEIRERGYSEERGAFVGSYGSQYLDAANLIMPMVRYVSPVDAQMLSTLDACMRPKQEGGLMAHHLVHRYDTNKTNDGLDGHEGTFNCCTFWLAEALSRSGRYRPEYLRHARLIFERMLGFAGPTGLYAEQTGPQGEALGNYPQGLTHLALISAAYSLDRVLDETRGKW